MKHAGRFQWFSVYWQEHIDKEKLFICLKKLISVINVGPQAIKINTKNHFTMRMPLHVLDLCINCNTPLYESVIYCKGKEPFFRLHILQIKE